MVWERRLEVVIEIATASQSQLTEFVLVTQNKKSFSGRPAPMDD